MNTLSSRSGRDAYLKSTFDFALRNALVAEKVCSVDTSDLQRIQNPYGSTGTATIQAVAGTYSVTAWTTTDDALTVDNEVIYAEHIFDHERIFSVFDLAKLRMDNMIYSVAYGVDYFVLNNLCEDGTGAYTTPVGGFTTAANINVIMANLLSKVAGYQDAMKGTYLIIENTDLVGFAIAGATNGFTMADMTIKNGFMNNWMGVDIYVVRSGTFVDATIGTKTVTNAGHRVFGVKGVTTYATPRGTTYDEKGVTGKTGKETYLAALVGFKAWAMKTSLTVDITLA